MFVSAVDLDEDLTAFLIYHVYKKLFRRNEHSTFSIGNCTCNFSPWRSPKYKGTQHQTEYYMDSFWSKWDSVTAQLFIVHVRFFHRFLTKTRLVSERKTTKTREEWGYSKKMSCTFLITKFHTRFLHHICFPTYLTLKGTYLIFIVVLYIFLCRTLTVQVTVAQFLYTLHIYIHFAENKAYLKENKWV